MEVVYEDPELEQLESEVHRKTRLPKEVVRAFRKKMNFVRQADDERDLYYPGNRCEKLKGDRSHQMSLRLNDQWRIVFQIEKGSLGNVFRVISVEDYHS